MFITPSSQPPRTEYPDVRWEVASAEATAQSSQAIRTQRAIKIIEAGEKRRRPVAAARRGGDWMLFVIIVGALPGLQAFGRVAIVGLKNFPQVLEANDEGHQQHQAPE